MELDNQENNTKNNSENEKYELLLSKEKEINEFLSNFNSEKNKEINEINNLQDKIEQTLIDLSEIQTNIDNLPDKEKAKDVEDGLRFTKEQTDLSKFTFEKLKVERDRNKSELYKLENMDKRLIDEINVNSKRIEEMKSDISNKFERVNEIKDELSKKINHLNFKKEFLQRKKE